jgi:neutral ceramidase
MRDSQNFLILIISWIVPILLVNSCAVVKTPYQKTDYYQNTLSHLDSIRSGTFDLTDSVYAGFSAINITPSLGNRNERPEYGELKRVPIAGFGQLKSKYATGIHDSIFIKAVAMKAGRKTLVIVGADLLLMPANIIDSVASILSAEGIKRDQLFFTATHTHSGIGGWGYGLLAKLIAGKENPLLERWLINQMIEAVHDAVADLQPASICSGAFNGSAYTMNRLTGNPAEKNDDFDYVSIEQSGGRNAIIGSFSAHATTIGRKNTLISADYPGYWERKMENSGADVAIFCGGSMGSQSPVGKGNDFESAGYIGESLADSLLKNLNRVARNRKVRISAISLPVQLPEYHMRLTKKKNLTTGLSKKLMPLPGNVYLQALRINNLVWIFTPADFSGESALIIKNQLAEKGFQAIISGYNGNYVGYIIPGKYFYLDKYESRSMSWFGPTMADYFMDLIGKITDVVVPGR